MHIIEYLMKNQKDCTTYQELWEEFKKMLIAQRIHENQIAAMKLAFDCGVATSLAMLKREICKQETEELAEAVIFALAMEVMNQIPTDERKH